MRERGKRFVERSTRKGEKAQVNEALNKGPEEI